VKVYERLATELQEMDDSREERDNKPRRLKPPKRNLKNRRRRPLTDIDRRRSLQDL
jgi:hypothetical protein